VRKGLVRTETALPSTEADRLEQGGSKQWVRVRAAFPEVPTRCFALGAVPVTCAGDVLELFGLEATATSTSPVGAAAQAAARAPGGGTVLRIGGWPRRSYSGHERAMATVVAVTANPNGRQKDSGCC
jgi:hypothetical protein